MHNNTNLCSCLKWPMYSQRNVQLINQNNQFYLEFKSRNNESASINSREISTVTNMAKASLPSACKSSLLMELSELYTTAEKPNVTLIMIIRKFHSILKDIDGIIEADITKVLNWCPV